VAGKGTNNVVVLSPAGKNCREILKTIHVEIGFITLIANIYRVYNGVCNDVYKYDFMYVPNCNSYNVFSCV
jgi:hypothetical protein